MPPDRQRRARGNPYRGEHNRFARCGRLAAEPGYFTSGRDVIVHQQEERTLRVLFKSTKDGGVIFSRCKTVAENGNTSVVVNGNDNSTFDRCKNEDVRKMRMMHDLLAELIEAIKDKFN